MGPGQATARIQAHLRALVTDIGPRPAGSAANRRATDYVAGVLDAAGLAVQRHPFTCLHWEPGDGRLTLPGRSVAVEPNPFSRPCDVRGPVARASTRDDLRGGGPPGQVLVIDGALTREPLFPKHFPYASFPEQQEVVALLEARRPAAVIAVAPAGPRLPILEDGDLAFPSTTVTPPVGALLPDGLEVGLRLGGRLAGGAGVNVSARTAGRGPRTVLCAHVDTKATTPGAFDNAGGVAALLALAEDGLRGTGPVELVLFNGEDHYAAPGEQVWFAATDLGEIRMAVNVDGAGLAGRRSTAAALSCPPPLERRLTELVAARDGWALADPWLESDHAVFALRGIPSIAVTSEGVHELLGTLAHTAEDTLDKVDPRVLAGVAAFVADWLRAVTG